MKKTKIINYRYWIFALFILGSLAITTVLSSSIRDVATKRMLSPEPNPKPQDPTPPTKFAEV